MRKVWRVGVGEDQDGHTQRCPNCYTSYREGSFVIWLKHEGWWFQYGECISCEDCGHTFTCAYSYETPQLALQARDKVIASIDHNQSISSVTLVGCYPEPSEALH